MPDSKVDLFADLDTHAPQRQNPNAARSKRKWLMVGILACITAAVVTTGIAIGVTLSRSYGQPEASEQQGSNSEQNRAEQNRTSLGE